MPQAKMLVFSFEAQTQKVKDMCLHFTLSSMMILNQYCVFCKRGKVIPMYHFLYEFQATGTTAIPIACLETVFPVGTYLELSFSFFSVCISTILSGFKGLRG